MYLMVVGETIEVFIFGITVEHFSKIWSDSGVLYLTKARRHLMIRHQSQLCCRHTGRSLLS
jgi:hypothetical protein